MNDRRGAADGSVQLDPENPWPGLDFFDERARDYFHGRDAEAADLVRRVTDAPLTVLFGKSGLGKTSLLKAGLFPRLRTQQFLPIYVRLAIRQDAPPFIDQACDAIRSTIAAEHIDAPEWPEDQTLWEFLHRRDAELWSPQNFPLVPLIVFDQFEELFTLGEGVPQAVERFKIELADLAENRIPEALAALMAADAALSATLDVRAMPCKFIISLREDFLPDLEEWRRTIPSLGRTRLRLLPMNREQAMSAVYDTAPHLMDRGIALRIVEFVAAAQTAHRAGPELQDPGGQQADWLGIEPALLSLFCRGLNERRKIGQQARFDDDLLEGAKQGIISDYYRSCVEALPASVSRFIENELITEKGFRNSYSRDDAVPERISSDQLDYLIKRRLLRIEERYGTERIELTHDLLTRAVMEHRTLGRQRDVEQQRALQADAERQRLESDTRRQRARFRVAATTAAAGLLLAGLAGYQWFLASRARALTDEALEDSQSRDLATQSMLVGTTDPTRALALALSSIELKQTPQSEVALRLAFARARLRGAVSPPANTRFLSGDVSPGGDRIAVVRSDGVVDVRSVPSLALLHSRPRVAPAVPPTGRAPESRPITVFFGSDSEDVFVVTPGKGVSRWKPANGSESSILSSPDTDGWAMRLTGSDRLLLNDRARIIVLQLSTGVVTDVRLCGSPGSAVLAAFSSGGSMLTALMQNDTLCHGVTTKSLKVPGAEAASLARFSQDGKRLVTSNYLDEVVRVWDVAAATEIAAIRGFTAAPSSVSFVRSQDLAVGVFDGVVELWHFPRADEGAKRADQIAQLTGSPEQVIDTFAVSDAQSILTLHLDGPLRLWQGLSSVPKTRVSFDNPIDQTVVNSRGALVAVDIVGRLVGGSADGRAEDLLPSSSQPGRGFPIIPSRNRDRTHALAAWPDGLVRVWNLDEGTLLSEFKVDQPLVAAIWATPGCPGKTAGARPAASSQATVTCAVATVDTNRLLRVHALDGTEVPGQRWTLPSGMGVRGVLSPDWKHWIEEQQNGLAIVDLQTTAILARELEGGLFGYRWPFVRGGASIVIRGYGVAFVQPLNGTSNAQALKGHATHITSAVVSPDGSRVLTASDDWTARIWDASSGSLLSTLRGHVSGVIDAIFSRDGSLVATRSRDRTIRVWEPVSGTQIFRFELGSGSGALSDFNGSSLVFEDSRRAWLIDCEPCRPLAELQRIGRNRLNVRVE